MKPPLPFVVLALALHVGLAAGLLAGPTGPGAHASAPVKREPASAVTVRQLANLPMNSAQATAVPAKYTRTTAATSATSDAPTQHATSPQVQSPVVARDAAPGEAPPRSAGLDDYLPRSMLTLAPTPAESVLIPFPPDVPQGRHVFILALYIDEAGLVREVRIEDGAQSSVLADAARNAFLAARFTPGQLDDRVVKSRIRVEVVFENRPLDVELAQY